MNRRAFLRGFTFGAVAPAAALVGKVIDDPEVAPAVIEKKHWKKPRPEPKVVEPSLGPLESIATISVDPNFPTMCLSKDSEGAVEFNIEDGHLVIESNRGKLVI